MTHGATELPEASHGNPPCGIASTDGLARVAVLFAREDSAYKTLPECEVYDMARDARNYDGPWPVVAHPPCQRWGKLGSPRPRGRNRAVSGKPVGADDGCFAAALGALRQWGGS